MANKRKSSVIDKKNLALRMKLWPAVKDDDLWDRQKHDGFIKIPRAIPFLQLIMNSLSSGKPVGQTYFTLWCHNFDINMVVITNPKAMAYESGFKGQRAEATWVGRMRILKDFGFIDCESGASGEFNYVLVYNPYLVVKKLYENGDIREKTEYNALLQRMRDIGANDLD